jgi:signal transduction histidine kinase
MTYAFGNSYRIDRLEFERDSLIRSFNRGLIDTKNVVPILLLDKENDTVIATNLTKKKLEKKQLQKTITALERANTPIDVVFSNVQNSILYYDQSRELQQLKYYPYIQIGIVALFIFIAYLIFSTFRKAEQNQVWAGMAKETAHQLGTPLSSLIAWIELLDAQGIEQSTIQEMRKDVSRLEIVTNRFSKIGSETVLDEPNIIETFQEVVDYFQKRVSSKIKINFSTTDDMLQIMHNRPLMAWVGENLIKNAIDAMKSNGEINIVISQEGKSIFIDVSDTGKGIPQKDVKNVFKPGFTSKKRGWGLGLSLVKRIVSEYHKGKIIVYKTEVGVGTTFRITLYK